MYRVWWRRGIHVNIFLVKDKRINLVCRICLVSFVALCNEYSNMLYCSFVIFPRKNNKVKSIITSRKRNSFVHPFRIELPIHIFILKYLLIVSAMRLVGIQQLSSKRSFLDFSLLMSYIFPLIVETLLKLAIRWRITFIHALGSYQHYFSKELLVSLVHNSGQVY